MKINWYLVFQNSFRGSASRSRVQPTGLGHVTVSVTVGGAISTGGDPWESNGVLWQTGSPVGQKSNPAPSLWEAGASPQVGAGQFLGGAGR